MASGCCDEVERIDDEVVERYAVSSARLLELSHQRWRHVDLQSRQTLWDRCGLLLFHGDSSLMALTEEGVGDAIMRMPVSQRAGAEATAASR